MSADAWLWVWATASGWCLMTGQGCCLLRACGGCFADGRKMWPCWTVACPRWVAEGRPTERSCRESRATFTMNVRFQNQLVRDRDQVAQASKTKAPTNVDAASRPLPRRGPEPTRRFCVQVTSPVRANLPTQSLLKRRQNTEIRSRDQGLHSRQQGSTCRSP